jgi:hypothetical protein
VIPLDAPVVVIVRVLRLLRSIDPTLGAWANVKVGHNDNVVVRPNQRLILHILGKNLVSIFSVVHPLLNNKANYMVN